MSDDAPSTVVAARTQTDSAEGGDPRAEVPALTILWHYDLSRVGQVAALPQGRSEISRYTKPFDSVADVVLSRAPFLFVEEREGGLVLGPGETKTAVSVNAMPLQSPRHVTRQQLRDGVVITLSDEIVVCLHMTRAPRCGGEPFGLVGTSDCIDAVRNQIEKVATLDAPVLIRGESGTGKELVARAIAAHSRSPEPFVAINMGDIPVTMAVDSLFGHEKGAFTGAAEARPGYFGEADGGTLFLDEIASTPLEVQKMLLRVLETGEIRPLGSRRPRKVRVRLLTATDKPLETAVADGTFEGPLLYRIEGYRIDLPPLRARRDDVGSLLLHFLRGHLAATSELDRLDPTEPGERPWLDARDFTRIALAPFPGNLRSLNKIASHLAISSRGQRFAHLDSEIKRLLVASEPRTSTRSREAAAPVARKPGQPTDEQVEAALRQTNFSVAAAARELRINRSTIYERLRFNPNLVRTAESLSDAEILDAYDRAGGDIARMAADLRVPPKPLKHRLVDVLRRNRR